MINCRKAQYEDLLALVEGNEFIASETEDMVLKHEILVSGVASVLNDQNKGIYWVAEIDNKVSGQILITYEWSDWRNGFIWWIQSVFVWPQFRRQGVFKALLKTVETEALLQSVVELRLYADINNRRAHTTYNKQGFSTGHYQVFEKSLK